MLLFVKKWKKTKKKTHTHTKRAPTYSISHNCIKRGYETLGLLNIKYEIQTCISTVAFHLACWTSYKSKEPYTSFPSLTAVHFGHWTQNHTNCFFVIFCQYQHMYISINSLCSMHFEISLSLSTFNQTPVWAPGVDTTEFNLCLIRPEDVTSHSLTTKCFSANCRHAATCLLLRSGFCRASLS